MLRMDESPVVALVAAALFALARDGAPPARDDVRRALARLVREREDEIEQRRRAILSESLADGAPDWAGSYHTGDGLGVNVTIDVTPNGGAVYTWHGCMGLYDANVGVVEHVGPDRVRVKWEVDPIANNAIWPRTGEQRYTSDEFLFVDWGDEHYALSSGLMLAFCNAFNAAPDDMHAFPLRKDTRSSYQHGSHRRRRPDELPRVPPEYRSYLLAEPLVTKIASIEDAHEKTERTKPGRSVELRAVVHVGREHGLLSGMILWIQEPHDPWIGTVTEVGPSESTVLFRAGRVGVSQHPRVGKTISTRKLAD